MKSETDDKRMELTEHLGELRTRIIRCIWYLFIGSVLAYRFFTPVYELMYAPLHKEINRLNETRTVSEAKHKIDVDKPPFNPLDMPKPHSPPTVEDLQARDQVIAWIYTHPATPPMTGEAFNGFHEMFLVRMQLSVILGFIFVTPLLIREIALFILPALTPKERRPLQYLLPVSIVCLLAGISVAYATLFFAMHWFLSYLGDFPHGAVLLQDPGEYILFFVKMMAAFGFAFQLPVLLMAGSFVGMVTSEGLIKHWRWGIVLGVLGGVFTPANDIFSMALMAVPLMLLYFGSIFLVKMVERMKARDRFKPA